MKVKTVLVLHLLVMAVALNAAPSAENPLSIVVEGVLAQPRQFVVRWSAPGCSELYISNIGPVEAETGAQPVEPKATSTYTLFAQRGSIVFQESATAIIEGKKGIDWAENVDFASYQHPITFECHPSEYVSLLKRIHQILQNELHYSVSEIEKDHRHVFLTSWSDPSGPHAYDPSTAWRIGLLVTVQNPTPTASASGASLVCELRARVQRRLRLEEVWRTEGDSNLHRMQLEALRDKLFPPPQLSTPRSP